MKLTAKQKCAAHAFLKLTMKATETGFTTSAIEEEAMARDDLPAGGLSRKTIRDTLEKLEAAGIAGRRRFGRNTLWFRKVDANGKAL